MFKKTLSAIALITVVLPGANAAKWLEGENLRVSTVINQPFVPDTSGAVTINGFETEGIPVSGSEIFNINIKMPRGVGSFKLAPENFRQIGRYFVGDLSQTKDGNKYVLNYYLEGAPVGAPFAPIKDTAEFVGSEGQEFKIKGIYNPTSAQGNTSTYPWGTYSGTIKVTYFSR